MITDEKAQQDPHCSWFLTGVTAPWVRQSKLAGVEPWGILASRRSSWDGDWAVVLRPVYIFLNSSAGKGQRKKSML